MDEMFVIDNSNQRSTNLLPAIFFACCKKFVNFQIDLFTKDSSFPLKTINCNYAWATRDEDNVDFDYNDSFFEIYGNESENDSDYSSENEEQTTSNYVAFSVCYIEMKTNLIFDRFCYKHKQIFKMYFTWRLHIFSNSSFHSE